MKTEHPYAAILRAIADGDAIQVASDSGGWMDLSSNGVLYEIGSGRKQTFRIKPRTITINGIEVPEPMRVAPSRESRYFAVSIGTTSTVSGFIWECDDADVQYLQRGLVHATREAAEAHARALLSFTEVK